MPKADTPPGFKPLKDTALFSPFKLGPLNLEHRIVQAPLTRMRATKESDAVFVPQDLHVEYYSQRATKGGLQLTEATDISKYVRPSRSINVDVFSDIFRLAATQASRASSQIHSSPVGRRSPMQYTQRVGSLFVSCGILDEPRRLHSVQGHQQSVLATFPWKAVGSMG
jgi:hypothetical protein